MNTDSPWRLYRFIEARSPDERAFASLVEGWLEAAETLAPRAAKALLEEKCTIVTPDGATFCGVSFKREHSSVEAALPGWAKSSGRRWATVAHEQFTVSDGSVFPVGALEIHEGKKVQIDVTNGDVVESILRKVWRKDSPNQRPDGTSAKTPPSNPSQGAAVPHP